MDESSFIARFGEAIQKMVASIELKMLARENERKYGHIMEALEHAILELEPVAGREYIKEFLVEQRKRYDWEVQESGVSKQEERLLSAYDYVLSLPIEASKNRYTKIGTHIVRQEGKVPNITDEEKWFIGELHGTLLCRPEEREARRQVRQDLFRSRGHAIDKNPTPEQKARVEEGKRRREERERIKENWREIQEESGNRSR